MAFEITDVLLIAIIMGLVEVAKRAGMPERVAPIVSVVLGVVGGVFVAFPGDIRTGVVFGLMVGLSAVGLFSGAKNTLGK